MGAPNRDSAAAKGRGEPCPYESVGPPRPQGGRKAYPYRSRFMTKLSLIALLALVMVTIPALAQQPAQQAAQQPEHIIADVHPSTTSRMYAWTSGGVISEGRYAIRDAGMLKLIKEAYGINQDDIAGGPGWISYDMFDVVFKVPDGTTPETVRPMLQSVLADRFV